MYKTVKIPKLKLDQIHKFVARFTETDECWMWKGAMRRHGYGCFSVNSHTYSAHRISYELFNDTEIPEKMTIDHLCMNNSCVNPKHLEVVTIHENIVRGREKNQNRKKRVDFTKSRTLKTNSKL